MFNKSTEPLPDVEVALPYNSLTEMKQKSFSSVLKDWTAVIGIALQIGIFVWYAAKLDARMGTVERGQTEFSAWMRETSKRLSSYDVEFAIIKTKLTDKVEQ